MKLAVILLFFLHCGQAVHSSALEPAAAPHPLLGPAGQPASGAAIGPTELSDPTLHDSGAQKAALMPEGRLRVTEQDADGAIEATCYVPTLSDWALRRASSGICSLHPDDDGGDVGSGVLPATALVGAPELNASDAQPSQEPQPPPEAAAEEAEDEERQNFAAAKDGAKIVAANKEAKKAASLLDDDGDTFLKNECKAEPKFVIMELAQMAKVDTLKVNC